jgi:hypothetical protein
MALEEERRNFRNFGNSQKDGATFQAKRIEKLEEIFWRKKRRHLFVNFRDLTFHTKRHHSVLLKLFGPKMNNFAAHKTI